MERVGLGALVLHARFSLVNDDFSTNQEERYAQGFFFNLNLVLVRLLLFVFYFLDLLDLLVLLHSLEVVIDILAGILLDFVLVLSIVIGVDLLFLSVVLVLVS